MQSHISRRKLIKNSVLALGGIVIIRDLFARRDGPVFGHNGMRYRLNKNWGTLNISRHPVKDCHEMVQDSRGRILLLTNETKNNILIYNKSGKLISSWGHEFPGGHGLTLQKSNGEDFLFITDTARHQVIKATIDGKLLLTIDYPAETGFYAKKEEFVPTETAVTEQGEFYVADGYGKQHIMHYSAEGKLKNVFGGKGDTPAHFDNAHGITIDTRQDNPTLLITDRTRNCFKRFSMTGNYIESIELPGACVCRPVIYKEFLYAAVLRSPDIRAAGTGFVTILDKNNKVVSNIGGSEPVYQADQLQPMKQEQKIFVHPHDVCVDDDENLYVAQWDSGKVYPYKFLRV